MKLLTLSDIAEMLTMTHNYVRDRITKRPDFPRPALSLSQKTRRWNEDDVRAWVAQCAGKIAR